MLENKTEYSSCLSSLKSPIVWSMFLMLASYLCPFEHFSWPLLEILSSYTDKLCSTFEVCGFPEKEGSIFCSTFNILHLMILTGLQQNLWADGSEREYESPGLYCMWGFKNRCPSCCNQRDFPPIKALVNDAWAESHLSVCMWACTCVCRMCNENTATALEFLIWRSFSSLAVLAILLCTLKPGLLRLRVRIKGVGESAPPRRCDTANGWYQVPVLTFFCLQEPFTRPPNRLMAFLAKRMTMHRRSWWWKSILDLQNVLRCDSNVKGTLCSISFFSQSKNVLLCWPQVVEEGRRWLSQDGQPTFGSAISECLSFNKQPLWTSVSLCTKWERVGLEALRKERRAK